MVSPRAPAAPPRAPGELAIVLHSHMPYVEGFGTWPFGEEWLWEAIATSYLPLLDVLGRAPLTLSLTPVLCDQLEAPGVIERCLRFLTDVRPESHRLDAGRYRAAGQERLASEVSRSALDYADAARRLTALGEDGLLGALGAHATWTSSATHAVLPLIASDSGISLQLQSGVAAHRRRFGDWNGGFWLPECAHAPWLDEQLEQAGVRSACVELTNVFGLGDERQLQPLATAAGPVLWPVDRAAMALVWSEEGYPSRPPYRTYHGLTPHHHRVWRNDGRPYEVEAAHAQAAADASDFVGRVKQRLEHGGICVCALDTELLGHWWYEGVAWLAAVIDETARQDVALATLDNALERHQPVPAPAELPVTSWGTGCDMRTWSGSAVAELAWLARSAELRLLAETQKPGDRALRELLALQASDWPFMVARQVAGEYPWERARSHAQALSEALAGRLREPSLRNLAPELAGWTG